MCTPRVATKRRAHTQTDDSTGSEAEKQSVRSASPRAAVILSARRRNVVALANLGALAQDDGRLWIVQNDITPTSFSTSAVSTIAMASQGQPSRKQPSGPLLVHFLQPMQSSGST